MDWTQFLRGDMGWAASVGMAVYIAKLIISGQLILKREFEELKARSDKAISVNEESVKKQAETAEKVITTQAALIDALKERDGK